MRKLERMANELNERFREDVVEVMAEEFNGLEVHSYWNIMAMRLVTERIDGKEFTRKQHDFLRAYSEGYSRAMDRVREADLEK